MNFATPLLAAGGHAVEATLLLVLIQLCVIIVVARVFAMLFSKIGQPAVVGEIIAGLILGPSVFGHFYPDAFHRIFDGSVNPILRHQHRLRTGRHSAERLLHAGDDGGADHGHDHADSAADGPRN